jgi:hypothetical protein
MNRRAALFLIQVVLFGQNATLRRQLGSLTTPN